MRHDDAETVIIREPSDTMVVERIVPVREPTSPAVWFLIGLLVAAILVGLAWLFTRDDGAVNDELLAAQTEAAAASATAQQAVVEANAARTQAALSDARAQMQASGAAAARAAEAAGERAEAAAGSVVMVEPAPQPAAPAADAVVTGPSTP